MMSRCLRCDLSTTSEWRCQWVSLLNQSTTMCMNHRWSASTTPSMIEWMLQSISHLTSLYLSILLLSITLLSTKLLNIRHLNGTHLSSMLLSISLLSTTLLRITLPSITLLSITQRKCLLTGNQFTRPSTSLRTRPSTSPFTRPSTSPFMKLL